jgi:hypothetical protein
VPVVGAALLVVPTALAVLGTYLYGVPYIGLATAYVPWYLPWLIVASAAGGVLALFRWRVRRSRCGLASFARPNRLRAHRFSSTSMAAVGSRVISPPTAPT